jgi:formate--tetrahydrofolate ligase
MQSDIEIAQQSTMKKITDIAMQIGIPEASIEPYGHYKGKIALDYLDTLDTKPDGKLILVTAISPTPAGEGKTTTTVGLGDALNRIGKKAIICLREPSLGPKWCRWKISICISPATLRPLPWPIICSPQ